MQTSMLRLSVVLKAGFRPTQPRQPRGRRASPELDRRDLSDVSAAIGGDGSSRTRQTLLQMVIPTGFEPVTLRLGI
jgi:hypothetical protein